MITANTVHVEIHSSATAVIAMMVLKETDVTKRMRKMEKIV